MPTHASQACAEGDLNCRKALGTHKPRTPGQGAYPLTFISFLSEVRATSSGGRLSMKLVVRNDTTEVFGPFDTAVYPGMVAQGRPLEVPPVFLIHIDGLKPGETGEFGVNDVEIQLPSDGIVNCRDRDFPSNN